MFSMCVVCVRKIIMFFQKILPNKAHCHLFWASALSQTRRVIPFQIRKEWCNLKWAYTILFDGLPLRHSNKVRKASKQYKDHGIHTHTNRHKETKADRKIERQSNFVSFSMKSFVLLNLCSVSLSFSLRLAHSFTLLCAVKLKKRGTFSDQCGKFSNLRLNRL